MSATTKPKPKFAPGDLVTFDWTDDQTPNEVWYREWREFEHTWSYRIRGDKWYNENGMRKYNGNV